MDAKPHRPGRTFKLRDENIPPSILPAGKTLHQRNKSSPALSSFAQIGGFKFGAKRAAFADVSNTSRNVQSIKDDSALCGKGVVGAQVLKDVPAQETVKISQETSKPAPFLRPAQRPVSVSSIKGLFNQFSSHTSSSNAQAIPLSRPAPEEIAHPLNVKVPISKKSSVFREPAALPPVVEAQNAVRTLVNKPLPLEPQPIAHTCQAETEPIEALPSISMTRDHLSTITESEPSNQTDHLPVKACDAVANLTSDATQPYSNETASENHIPRQDPLAFDSPEVYEDAQAHIPSLNEHLIQDAIDPAANSVVQPASELPMESNYPLPESEFEYWDEEAYDERYEEDGYTTARSLKSRGDYTTGPTTIVLAPRVTAAVERELAAARQFVQDSKTADDIDEDESWDTSMVAEYGDEIFDYMRTLEERMRPNPYYMDNQTEVQWSMRSVLMDWLVQVHHRFSLLPETLFLCVNYIDRFLSCKVVSLGKLQLVGATAIFIAAKYEEINCPSIQEIVYMVDGGYTVDEILKAERFMLSMLQFELGWPGPMSFLRRVSKADDYDLETRTLAKYFLEITIMDERFVGCIPSFTAAGAHCLARLMLKKGPWSQAHVYYSNYTYSQLRPLLSAILSCCDDPQKHHAAIFDKYSDKRFKRASLFVQTEMSNNFCLPAVSRVSTSSSFVSASDVIHDDYRIIK